MLLRSGKVLVRVSCCPLKIRRPCRRPRRKHHTLNSNYCTNLPLVQHSCTNGICTPHKCATTFLKNKSGKYVTLSKRGGLKLVARDTQSGAITSNLEIWKWDTKIAFCFKYESEIYLVTESEQRQNELELKLITDDAKQTIQNLHPWFEMENAGDHHYCIHTASSKKYLTIDTTRKTNSLITLSENQAMDSTFCTPPCQCNEEGCPGV